MSILSNRHRPNGEDKVAIDPEQQLYKDMAELKSEIKSLKTRLTKLSGRIESLELMDFQSQILKIGEKIDSINEHLVITSRYLADLEMNLTQYLIADGIQKHLHGEIREQVKNRIMMSFAQAREALKHSSNPHEITRKFVEECEICSKSYKLRVFMD